MEVVLRMKHLMLELWNVPEGLVQEEEEQVLTLIQLKGQEQLLMEVTDETMHFEKAG